MTIEQVAQICNDANKAYCNSIGDYSPVSWDLQTEEFKQSSVKGVQFRLENLNATSEDQHNSWMKERLDNGWVFGEITDKPNKIHNCLKPYSELPEEQRVKDYIFAGIVKSVAEFVK